jgi:hypothetical protein
MVKIIDSEGNITEFDNLVDAQSIFERIGLEIGKLVTEKNLAYGDSFSQSCKILNVLFPDGVRPEQYRDLLTITRIIDKLFRIATAKDALGESPWRDVCGYSILSIWRDEEGK